MCFAYTSITHQLSNGELLGSAQCYNNADKQFILRTIDQVGGQAEMRAGRQTCIPADRQAGRHRQIDRWAGRWIWMQTDKYRQIDIQTGK